MRRKFVRAHLTMRMSNHRNTSSHIDRTATNRLDRWIPVDNLGFSPDQSTRKKKQQILTRRSTQALSRAAVKFSLHLNH